MSKIINITDKLNDELPKIVIGEKEYPVNDGMDVVLKFEELASKGNSGLMEAMEMALGKKAFNELKVNKMSVNNFMTLTSALIAAMQGITFEEAEKRFRERL